MERLKRVAAIHDLSAVGKCSLTVALPILSAGGVECACMPTAVLSTHTGGFTGFTFRDLTEDLLPMADHWKAEGVEFDAFYTGYLGSVEQIGIVRRIFDMFRTPDTLVLVDPVMADNGKLYPLFTMDMVRGMAELCGQADILVPNRTEAAFMLGWDYEPGDMTEAQVEKMVRALAGLDARPASARPKRVVLTGVHFNSRELGAACYDEATGRIEYCMNGWVEGYFHGSGDVFGSALMGALMRGRDLTAATQIAVDFTREAVRQTSEDKSPPRMGVRFEAGLAEYGRLLNS